MRSSLKQLLTRWLAELRGDRVVPSRQASLEEAGLPDAAAVAFALSLAELASAQHERREPSPVDRPDQIACYLSATALEILCAHRPPLDQAPDERVERILKSRQAAWSLDTGLATRTTREALAEIDRLLEPHRRTVRRLAWSRAWVRWRARAVLAGALALVLLSVAGTVRAVRGPDLLAGRPYRVSSTTPEYDMKSRTYGGKLLPIFLHTKEEASPWLEYDLGQPTKLHRVVAANRRDCCGDRAVPLVIEVSDDARTWKAVARQDRGFSTWEARFDAVTARYLRLRIDRKSLLHLQSVEAYGR